jgi:long-subunit acyl-CoA synthetase (AMP-forming)
MTENMAYSHLTKPGEVRPGYVGSPVPGVQQRISEDGEILVKSPGNMTGYYKMPEKTAEDFTEDGFFKTGDMGEIDEKGRLKITGRIKELFKTSKGKYVAPAPIENLLANHPRVEACCVTGVGYPQPYGVVMLSEEARGTREQAGPAIESELAEHLNSINAALSHHERLAFLVLVKDEWLPENGFLTPTMKLKRSRLEETYAPLADGWYAENKPIVWQV